MDDKIKVHWRINRRHPEISPEDVACAWGNRIATGNRCRQSFEEIVAVGFDAKGRLLEMVAVIEESGLPLVYHAMTPPSKKTLHETGLID